MMTNKTVLLAMLLSVGACASTPSSDDAHDAAADAAVGLPDGSTAGLSCTAGQSAQCVCPVEDGGAAASGTQQCFEGAWLLCNCQRSTMQPAVSTAGACLPGYYAGQFEGEYSSGFQFGGSLKVSGALNLTLNEKMDGAGEFANYTISGGNVTGKANDRFPFNGMLTGELNCTTKVFMGVLEGCYQVVEQLSGLAQGCFKGPMNAMYDATSKSFVAGTWDVLEPTTVLFQMLGGNGTWTAPYSGPSAPNDGGIADAATADAASPEAGSPDAGANDAGP